MRYLPHGSEEAKPGVPAIKPREEFPVRRFALQPDRAKENLQNLPQGASSRG
jgi:hypothetical protein